MSLELYDLALEKKLKNIFENVIMAPPDDAFARSNKEGKVKLPLISAYRMSTEVNWDEFNHPASFHGATTRVRYRHGYEFDKDGNPRVTEVNQYNRPSTNPYMREGLESYRMTETIPIRISYQIDIWAQLRKYADEIFREVAFYFLHYPDLLVEIPSVERPLVFSLQLTDTATETDYEFGETNTIHRYSLTYEVPFAQLFYEPDSTPPVLHIPTTYLVHNDAHNHVTDEEYTMVEATEDMYPKDEDDQDEDEEEDESSPGGNIV